MISIKPKAEGNIILCVENLWIQYNYMPKLTVKLFLSINGKTSHQKETENKRAIAINCNLYPKYILKGEEYMNISASSRQKKIRIFSLGRKNNILIKRKERK